MYKIIRFYEDSRRRRTIKKNLSLEEAQQHCRDDETSSSTCSAAKTKRVSGRWFDGYEEQ